MNEQGSSTYKHLKKWWIYASFHFSALPFFKWIWCDQVHDQLWDRVRVKLRIALVPKSVMPICICKDLLRISKIGILRLGIKWKQLGNFKILAKFNAINLLSAFLDQNLYMSLEKWRREKVILCMLSTYIFVYS